jgi:hypothetical protein
MKKIIHGKTYNTDNAELIASWSNGFSSSDFNHCNEDLYRTKKGAYFIAGSGGPLSCYAESLGDSQCGGEEIKPLSKRDALKWCEEMDINPDITEEEFSDLIEDA